MLKKRAMGVPEKSIHLGNFSVRREAKLNAKVVISGDGAQVVGFVGLKRCQKHTLQMWLLESGKAINIQANPRQKGLGDVAFIRPPDKPESV